MAASGAPTADSGARVGGARVRPCVALEDDLGWTLGTVFRSYVKAANVVAADVPGGPRGYQVLAAAASDALGTQLALAHQLGVDRTVMTYLLDDLERAGLIERRPDPADRRVRRIAVTDQGRVLIADLDSRLAQAEEHLLAPLSEADRATFRQLLRRLALETTDPPSDLCTVVEQTGMADDETLAANPRRARRRRA